MYTISKAAELAGITVKALRHYERMGLLTPPERSASGYRLYSQEDLAKIRQIRYYRDLNFALKDIPSLLKGTPEERKAAVAKQIRLVQESSKKYAEIEDHLIDIISQAVKARGQTAIIGISLQWDFLRGSLSNERVRRIIEPVKQLITKGRRHNLPIIYVCDCHETNDEELRIWGDHALKGSKGAQIIDELAPEKGDHIIHKTFFSGFYQTDLNLLLRRLNVGKLIITGLFAHMCVAETIIEAHRLGYHVEVPKECVESLTEADCEFGLRLVRESYGIQIASIRQILDQI